MSLWNVFPLNSTARVQAGSRRGRGWAKRAVASALLASLAASASNNDFYPTKGDAKPHPGVARAKNHPIQGIDISKWQGPLRWALVRGPGTQRAFVQGS